MSAAAITNIGIVNKPFTPEDLERIRERKQKIARENAAAQKEFQEVTKIHSDINTRYTAKHNRARVLNDRKAEISREVGVLTSRRADGELTQREQAAFDNLMREEQRLDAELRIVLPEVAKLEAEMATLAPRFHRAGKLKLYHDAVMEGERLSESHSKANQELLDAQNRHYAANEAALAARLQCEQQSQIIMKLRQELGS